MALAATGALGAWIGGGSKMRAAVRVVVGGALALVATFSIGNLLGASGVAVSLRVSSPKHAHPAGPQRAYGRSSAGRAWLASLPGLIQGRLEHWELAVDLAPARCPWNGHGGVVVPVLGRTAARSGPQGCLPPRRSPG